MYTMRNERGNVIYIAKTEKERDYYLKNGFTEEIPTVTGDDGEPDRGEEITPPADGNDGEPADDGEVNEEDQSSEGEDVVPESDDASIDDESDKGEEKPAQNKAATRGRRSAANK